jgi:hypothetical protein
MFRTNQDCITSIKTRLDIQRFRIINLRQPIYGHPKPVESLQAFQHILGAELPQALVRVQNQSPSTAIRETPATASPFPTPSSSSTPSNGGSFSNSQSFRELSEELGDPLDKSIEDQLGRKLPVDSFLENNPVPSIKMAHAPQESSLSVASFANGQVWNHRYFAVHV